MNEELHEIPDAPSPAPELRLASGDPRHGSDA